MNTMVSKGEENPFALPVLIKCDDFAILTGLPPILLTVKSTEERSVMGSSHIPSKTLTSAI